MVIVLGRALERSIFNVKLEKKLANTNQIKVTRRNRIFFTIGNLLKMC